MRGDHEMYFYDPIYFNRNYSNSIDAAINSIYRRCAYGYDTNYHLFDYATKFFDTYKDEKKVMYMDF